MTKKPNFFTVGVPRSGTTAMYEYLKAHPEIYMSPFKAPHYFATDLEPPNPWTAKYREKEAYLNLFHDVSKEKIIGEASVLCLYSENAARNIYKFNPQAKILITLRNPVEAMYSLYWLSYLSGAEPCGSFKEALGLERDRKIGNKLPKNKLAMKYFYFYRDLVDYNSQLRRYFDVFDKDQIKIIIFEDFKNSTRKTYKEVLNFLNVDDSFSPQFVRHNQARIVKNKYFLQFTQKLANTFSFLDSDAFRRLSKGYLFLEKIFTKKTDYKKINVKLKKQLSNEFESDIKKLSKFISRDLSHWLK